MPPKECPPGKILNPATGRCVDENGKIGRALRGLSPSTSSSTDRAPKECPPGKIMNPATGRCVDENGKIGLGLRGVNDVADRMARLDLGTTRMPNARPAPRPAPPTRQNRANNGGEAIGFKPSFIDIVKSRVRSNTLGQSNPGTALVHIAASVAARFGSIVARDRAGGADLEEVIREHAPDDLADHIVSEIRFGVDATEYLTWPRGMRSSDRLAMGNLVLYLAAELAELGETEQRQTGASPADAVRFAMRKDPEYRQVLRALV